MKHTCIICSSENTELTTQIARDVESLKLIKCKNCLHTFQPLEDYKDIYTTGEFTKVARSEANTPTVEKIKSLDKTALKRVEYYREFLKNFKNTLEVGSSIGSFISLLKLKGINAQGIEPDVDYANYSKVQYGFEQKAVLLEDYKPNEKYDSICSFHVLEHVKDPHQFIQGVSNLMTDDGKILFELPSMEIHSYGNLKSTYWSPHIHYFTLSSLYFLFSKYFKVEKIGFYGIALYIYATKKPTSTFDKSKFKKLKSRSKFLYNTIRLSTVLPFKIKGKTLLRQLLIQPFIQKNTRKLLERYEKIAKYHSYLDRFYLSQEKKGTGSKDKAFHVSYYNLWENAGDTILSQCVRRNFNLKFKQKWELARVTKPVTDQTISKINSCKYIVVGGGGLLLPDSNPNTISGWQWAVSEKQLHDIKVPLLIYSIGFNYFHGQKPNDLFIKNLNSLIERADFFGLRNFGSIEQVKKLVQPELADKIHWQPCTTTIIRKTFDEIATKQKGSSKNIAINMAFDRYEKRFDGNMHAILHQTALAMKDLQKKGYKIFVAGHLQQDFLISYALEAVGVTFTEKDLQYATPAECYDFYNNMELVFGSRGHAQMVPFGLNTKIISLGTHNKVKFFLDDIEANDWFINIREDIANLRNTIIDRFETVAEKEKSKTEERLLFQQKKLYTQTQQNFEIIKGIIK